MKNNLLILIYFLAFIGLALSKTCKQGKGVCLNKTLCPIKVGMPLDGLCESNEIKCCVDIKCGNKGKCMESSLCKGIKREGLCPEESFICCEKERPKPKPSSPEIGNKIADYALEALKQQWPYSFKAGRYTGASFGNIYGNCDDRQIKGFDSPGLTLYAVYQATGRKLIHSASIQYEKAERKGLLKPLNDKKRGDLVFFYDKNKEIYHVGIYIGYLKIIELPGYGKNCQRFRIRISSLIGRKDIVENVARFW